MMRRSIDAISVLSDDLAEYDIISDGQRSLESSITDLSGTDFGQKLREPPSTEEAKDIFRTAGSSADEIQDYVQTSLGGTRLKEAVARVYVDGFWDKLQTRCVSCERYVDACMTHHRQPLMQQRLPAAASSQIVTTQRIPDGRRLLGRALRQLPVAHFEAACG